MKKGIRKPKINTMTAEEIEERKKDLKTKLKELRREVNYKAEPRKKKKKKSIDEIRKEAELRKQRLIAELRRKLQGDTWKAQVDSGKYGSLTKSKGGYKHKRASGVDIRKFTGTRKTRMNEIKHKNNDQILHFGVKGMRWGIRRRLSTYVKKKGLTRETRLLNKLDRLKVSNPQTPKQGYKNDKQVLKTRYRLGKLQAKQLYKFNKSKMKEQADSINAKYKQEKKKIKAGEREGLNMYSRKNMAKAMKSYGKPLKPEHVKGIKTVGKSTRRRIRRDARTWMKALKATRKNALKARRVHSPSFTVVSHSDNDTIMHYGVVGMRKGVRRWLERRKALSAEKKKHNASTKEARKEIKRKYRADKKAFKNQLRAIRKEHRKGNIKEVVDENYRQLKGVSKWFNDRKTAKYLSENRGSELGRLTLSDKMFKKALKNYKKNSIKNLKLKRNTSLKALKFKKVQHGDDEVMMHHGVLGQRWGIRRRFKNLVGRLKGSKSGKKFDKNIRVSGDDIRKAKDIRKRKLRDLSDDDLRSAISRLKLEKEYNHLRNETGKTASGKIKKLMQLPVGYTKDGKKKELGPVLAEKLLNVAFNNKTFNSEVDSITSKGIDAIRDQAHKFKLSKKKKKG